MKNQACTLYCSQNIRKQIEYFFVFFPELIQCFILLFASIQHRIQENLAFLPSSFITWKLTTNIFLIKESDGYDSEPLLKIVPIDPRTIIWWL